MKTRCITLLTFLALCGSAKADHIRDLQTAAIEQNKASWGFWGTDPDNYKEWGTHSNRLIPVYAFGTKNAPDGVNLQSYLGKNSPYASEEKLQQLYGYVPNETLNPDPGYFDQTNLFDIQKAALEAGKKHIILVVFDGMDWNTTQLASIYQNQSNAYSEGRGTGLHMQDYDANGTGEYAFMVTSPYCNNADLDIDQQIVNSVSLSSRGGYAYGVAGSVPWQRATDLPYHIGRSELPGLKQAYTDSASSAASMTSGIKTYNASINFTIDSKKADTVAHLAQRQGYKIGVVTSVPISHATPGAAYAHNVHRDDYQDITRDLIGRKSSSHPDEPLPGVDFLFGTGFGSERSQDAKQAGNFVPGNAYLTLEDQMAVDVRNGGKYVVSLRSPGIDGFMQMQAQAAEAAETGKRFLGFYGTKYGHLPFRTADGQYDPTLGRNNSSETYTEADIRENPTLAQATGIALDYLNAENKPFWLMVEAGDVDWANHDNNIDNSIGAVISGDLAVKTITDWVEKNSSWEETVLLVTADHAHYFHLEQPEALLTPVSQAEVK